ncbi:Transcriptional regulator, AraC family [hydrothermal vent metagenome]|uniref:Transcriptional regulator, AraC family n=1 Tax=hydrothermal vent metagenome TaxID=652676 RepID=A0A3B0XUW4_9ZZZZ
MEETIDSEQLTIVVSVAAVLGKVLECYGLDKMAIGKKAGIDMDIAYKANDRISSTKLQKVWKIALKETGDDSIGITYASLIQPASLNGLGFAWIASDTLKDSINRLVRFQHSVTTTSSFFFNELDDCYQIILRSKLKNTENVSIDASIAALYKMCEITYGPDLKAISVRIAHKKPKNSKKFDDFFGVSVLFNTKKTQILFSKNTFEHELISANPDLARMNDQVVIDYLKCFDKKNIVLQVRARIIEELNNGIPNQEKIASSLNMSLRNLQRKLKGEGANFKMILDETRSELSKQYLRGSDRSIIEVGFLLGFSEPSNFARAFRRWTGVSPHEYREAP